MRDKKIELQQSLQTEIFKLIHPFLKNKNSFKKITKNLKADQTWVTEIDLAISSLVKKTLAKNTLYKKYQFLSEEEFNPQISLKKPTIILDPIDGTNELIKGIPECAVSLAIFHSSLIADERNFSFVYNPFTSFSLASGAKRLTAIDFYRQDLLGQVSRSEWEDNPSLKLNPVLKPRGSVAFKLALLASGASDFVISFRPKKIWDIAAGTHLCYERGYRFYSQGKEIKKLAQIDYLPPLVWCRPSLLPLVLKACEGQIFFKQH